MQEVQSALAAFLLGEINLDGLLARIDVLLAQQPDAATNFLAEVHDLYDQGRLPPQLLTVFESHVEQARQLEKTDDALPDRKEDRQQPSEIGPEFPRPAGDSSESQEPRDGPPETGSFQPPSPKPGESIAEQTDETRVASPPSRVPVGEPDPAPAVKPAPSEETRVAVRTQPTPPASGATSEDETRITIQKTDLGASTVVDDPGVTRVAARTSRPLSPARTEQTGAQSSASSRSRSATGTGTGRGTSSTALSYPPMPGEPEVGHVLNNRFELEKLIGRGGMGVVFKAKDRRKVEAQDRHPYVALKLLNESFKKHEQSLMALQREARKAQDLKHPNVISIFDFDKDENGNYFIAMELLSGDPLDRVIRQLRQRGGMPPREALTLIEQMGRALASAHRHKPPIVHSDFKPGNVFLTEQGDVKVFDFGIARAARPTGGGDQGEMTNFDAKTLGALTPPYASLEMLTGEDPDPRDDIYALGIVAYELLTGHRPFGRKKTAAEASAEGLRPKRIPSLTRRQWKGLDRALAFERYRRTPTVEQFLDDIGFRKSRTPWYVAAGTFGVGAAAWFLLVAPELRERREDKVLQEAAIIAPSRLPDLIESAQDFPDAMQQRLYVQIGARISQSFAAGDVSQGLAALDIVHRMPPQVSDSFYNHVVGVLAERIVEGDSERSESTLQIIETLPSDKRRDTFSKAADMLGSGIKNGDTPRVATLLDRTSILPEENRWQVYAQAKEKITHYYKRSVRDAFSPRMGKFDLASASALLKQAKDLFPDIATFDTEAVHLKDLSSEVFEDLNGKIVQLAGTGHLVRDGTAESIPSMLDTLTRLDPQRFPAEYKYLAPQYRDSAAEAKANGDLVTAETLVSTALGFFPDDAALLNEKTSIAFTRAKQQEEQAVAALKDRLNPHLAQITDLKDYTDLLDDLEKLETLRPDDPIVAQTRGTLDQLLEDKLSFLLDARSWDAATGLIEEYARLIPPESYADKQQRLRDARTAVEHRITDLSRQITEASQRQSPDDAYALLAQLVELAPDDVQVARAREGIARSYLTLAREARSAKRWDEARTFVNQGLERIPDEQFTPILRNELTEIQNAEEEGRRQLAVAERERLAQEQEAKIDAIRGEFERHLEAMPAQEKAARDALAILDRLANLSPTDPLVTSGRKRIALRFVDEAKDLGDQARWEEGIAMVRAGQSVVPEVDELGTELGRLKEGYSELLAGQKAQEIASRYQSLRSLVDQPQRSGEWQKHLLASLRAYEAVSEPDDPRLEQTKQDIAKLYVGHLGKLTEDMQFAQAQVLLDEALRALPDGKEMLEQERTKLAAAQKAWEQQQEERRRVAHIEGLKQSLLTQAMANETSKAEATLKTLANELGPDDEFVSRDGPEAIAQAYLRLFERRKNRKDFNSASQLLGRAAELAPWMPEIAAAGNQLTTGRESHEIELAVEESPATELRALETRLQALSTAAPEDYPALRDRWAEILRKRIQEKKSTEAKRGLLAAARALFASHPALNDIVIEDKPQPSVYAGKGLGAARKGRLTEAGQYLEQALKKEPEHPDVELLRKDLERRRGTAERTYAQFKEAWDKNRGKSARKHLNKAIALWSDNEGWKGTRDEIAKRDDTAKSSKDRCSPKFAGYGGKRRKARCQDILKGKNVGPSLVVVPAGGGNKRPFAITRFEISVGDYNLYCRLSGACGPVKGKGSKYPVTGISRAQAEGYAKWLSSVTGATYRLPKDGEWQHAAKAKGRQLPGSDFTCLLTSGGAVVKGGAASTVDRGSKNNWGLFNYVGNVQEWVVSGSGLSARGGHYNDPATKCSISLVRPHSGSPDKVTGFRLVREIKG